MNILEIVLKEAKKAYKKGEIPVGCVIVRDNEIISEAHNTKQKSHSCINHAEIIAITKAEKRIKDWRLNDCELYVSLEPCNMCKEVIRQARIKKVYYLEKSNFNNESNYCLVTEKDNSSLEICSKYKMKTIKTNEINENVLNYIKENLSNGKIYLINGSNYEDIKYSINYILSKGYKIVYLDELLDETNNCR